MDVLVVSEQVDVLVLSGGYNCECVVNVTVMHE